MSVGPDSPPESGGSRLSLAYIVSMASGLHSFVFREIRELTAMGVIVHLFPTKVGPGPYPPRADWPVHPPAARSLLGAHMTQLLSRPREYLSALGEAVRFGAPVDFGLAGIFSREIERHGLRSIHCHFGDHKLFIGYFSGRLTGRPVSVTIHAYELYDNPNPRLFRRALERVQAIVTIAEHNRTVLHQRWGVPPERVTVIPLFTDIPADPAPNVRKDGKVVILSVARFVEKKGHRTLLEALSSLPPEYEACLVGSGPVDVRALAKSFGVEGRVRVLERLGDEDLQFAYRSANIFCLPSETPANGDHEGIPVALMEAMAYGLPVVATRHAGIPELVEEVLIDERDPVALARALLRLGSDDRLRAAQGRRNREVVAARFSRGNAFLLESLFERLAG
jgi:colanic acid/amylovoran biosynthesis glycosyltransferase